MIKKIIVTLFATLIFFMPVQNGLFPNEADAFISKLMGLSAKKIAKEVAKDIAVESAANFAVNEAFKIADAQMAKYNQKEAYKIVCLYKMTGEVCDKPIAIKENLTEADKISIATQAEIELDKLVSPDGKGFTKWQKFMDWFGPLWVTSAIMTAVTYAIDSDVRSLFNEAGYNALVALGLITPVEENASGHDSIYNPTTGEPQGKEVQTNSATPSQEFTNERLSSARPHSYQWSPMSVPIKDTILITQFANNNTTGALPTKFLTRPYSSFQNSYKTETSYTSTVSPLSIHTSFNMNQNEAWTTINGEREGNISVGTYVSGTDGVHQSKNLYVSPNLFTDWQKTKSIMTRLPYQKDGFWYTDVLMFTSSGMIYGMHGKSTIAPTDTAFSSWSVEQSQPASATSSIKMSIYTNTQSVTFVPYEPKFEDGQEMTKSPSEDKYDRITLIPPVALPYNDIETGEALKISPNPTTGGEPIFTKPDGTVVPEENVTVGEPNVTPSPNGSPQVTPQPTPSNPNPEPISLNPPNTAPPIETDAPVFPEGESCSVGLKLPKISPLAYAVSESFPFSIPFDLYDGFQAIFSELGNEKPEFTYKLNFMGEQQEWDISIPDYFDSWKKFTDSFIIFIFDVGIIFMIFRFMGGSK